MKCSGHLHSPDISEGALGPWRPWSVVMLSCTIMLKILASSCSLSLCAAQVSTADTLQVMSSQGAQNCSLVIASTSAS